MDIDTKIKINKKLLKNQNDFSMKELSTKLSKMGVKISFLLFLSVPSS
jgi:molybdenum cofactor biosynthesis enzyme MoaA